jgi:DNA recombination protein RmuC
MDATLVVVLVLVAVVFLAVNAFFLWNIFKRGRGERDGDQSLVMLQQQLSDIRQTLDARLSEGQRQIEVNTDQIHQTTRAQQDRSERLIQEVTERLTKLDETNKQVVSFTDQLQSLQDILKNPKHRGVLGEYFLETVLKNTLPPGSYQMQYRFEDGEIVDAVVFVKDKVVPIDSKFSLENYNRLVSEKNDAERLRLERVFESDLKLRVKETSKYIRPKEGTTDFAFMFIPHEAIYYDLLVNKIGVDNILEKAAGEYKVLITSPTSFLAYLQTVLQGLKSLHIEEQAEEIIKRVGELGRHIGAYEMHMQKLGNNIATTVNSYNTAHRELGKIDKDVYRITGDAVGIESLALEKPAREE